MLSRLRSLTCSRWSLMVYIIVLLALTSNHPVEANIRLCGQRLTRTLFQLCRNQLCTSSSYSPAKRSLPSMPFFDVHHMMKRSGIATQCCMNKCSYAYLKTYCCID